jgi:hypothetical protein
VSHSKGLHSSPAQPRPVTSPHRRASTYPLVDYELRGANRTRPLRSARNLTHGARWRNAISAARVLSRFENHKGTNIHKDSWWSAPTMEEAGRRRGAQHQTQTATDSNNSYRRHRRTIVYRGAGGQDSWRRGQQGQRRPRVPNVILGYYQEGQGCCCCNSQGRQDAG